ncbi:predicted hydrolase [Jejuia pallidilutea]|uniref:Predicted hydrolase n=2 Tax=Jejuia pallidilutea TaxID=504487 RepID=A0A090WBH5_9FLAO|nr:predicted hydrolase [Jejuia pallidilutea]GAL72794.1 predicted hydrolase [Jejuia pallidilutea]
MAFGDYNNDLEMLENAYFSFAMENAHPLVKSVARFKTKSNNDLGVELVLEELLKKNKLVINS